MIRLEALAAEIHVKSPSLTLILGAQGDSFENIAHDESFTWIAHETEQDGAGALIAPDFEEISCDSVLTLRDVNRIEEQGICPKEPTRNGLPSRVDVLTAVHRDHGTWPPRPLPADP
jgi:hypothetical protein